MNKVRLKITLREYQQLVKKGHKTYRSPYLIYHLPYADTIIKTAAKKKLGNAVARNYEKRIVREILKSFQFKDNLLILVICCHRTQDSFERKRHNLSHQLSGLLA